MWFQHDGSPVHFSADVQSALDTAYPGRWIGRGGPVNWPARSPDLSCLDFFLWGHMKSIVYASSVDSDEAMVAKIAVVEGDIREILQVFANVPPPVVGGLHPCWRSPQNVLAVHRSIAIDVMPIPALKQHEGYWRWIS
ncbi:uncharacterized protein TNCV_3105651 [Trichonephila clavipes]|nr:uncharacterized protein TNCV_3105651 [Trichonephila clavipes]